MNKQFRLWKTQALSKLDKSSIGEIDKKIKSLCDTINEREDMFTLSSCSGRISLLKRKANFKKCESIWLTSTHSLAQTQEFLNSIEHFTSKETQLEFRQEASILHICVENQDLARELIILGKTCGYNQTGIIANKTKLVVELICDITLICPLLDKGKLLVSKEYIDYLIAQANTNQQENWKRIEKLQKEILHLKRKEE